MKFYAKADPGGANPGEDNKKAEVTSALTISDRAELEKFKKDLEQLRTEKAAVVPDHTEEIAYLRKRLEEQQAKLEEQSEEIAILSEPQEISPEVLAMREALKASNKPASTTHIPPDLDAEGYGPEQYIELSTVGTAEPVIMRRKDVVNDPHGKTVHLKSVTHSWHGSKKTFRAQFDPYNESARAETRSEKK